MRGWKSKLIFLLIIYFVGFATAIYCFAPVPGNQAGQPGEKSFVNSVLKSDEFAQSFNTGMRRYLDFARDVAWRGGTYLKQKLDDT